MATLRDMIKAEHEAAAIAVGKAEAKAKAEPGVDHTHTIIRLYNRLDAVRGVLDSLDNLTAS